MSGFLKLYFNARELAEQTKGLRRRHFDAIGREVAHGVTEKNGGRAPAFGGTMNKEKIKDALHRRQQEKDHR